MIGVKALLIGGIGFVWYFSEKNPLTGKRQIILWGEKVDIMIGKMASDQLKSNSNIRVYKEQSNEYQLVKEIALNLIPHFPIKRDWNITVIHDGTVNAMVTPDGSIFVFKGLIDITESIDELVWVIAHECSHVYLRHSASNLSYQAIVAVIVCLIQLYLFNDIYNISYITDLLFNLPMSRKNELEADLMGLKIATQLGLKHQGALNIIKKFQKSEEGLEIISTHPIGETRIQQLKTEIAKEEENSKEKEHQAARKQLDKAERLYRRVKGSFF